jgi:branched-chain amino acid transport system substrate-binding protein
VSAGHRHLGFLYCVEVSACSYAQKRIHDGGATAAGAQLVYESAVSITQPDYTAQCLNARNAGVDLLGLAVDGASMTRVARSCEAVGYRPLLAASAATMSPANAEDPGLRSFGLVSAGGVAPWTNADTPGLRAFHDAVTRLAPGLQPDGEAVIAWSSGKLLEAAIAQLTPAEQAGTLSADLVVKGLGAIQNETLDGLTARLSFTPGKPAVSSGCVWFERLGPSGWSAPNGSRPVCP